MSHIEDFMASRLATPTRNNNRSTFHTACDATTSFISRPNQIYRSTKKNFSRRISHHSDDLVVDVETSQHWEELERVVGSQWQVYHVSPLWNVPLVKGKAPLVPNVEAASRREASLTTVVGQEVIMSQISEPEQWQYDELALKRYSRFLAGHVATHAVSGMENPYKVEMFPMKALKGRRTDSDALWIEVTSSMEGETKMIFCAVLCGNEAAELLVKSSNCVNLPVLLTAGNQDTTDRIIFGLEKCFDCVIGPLELPSTELHWMAAMWAGLELGEVEEEGRTPLKEKSNNTNNKGSNKKSQKKPKKVVQKAASRNGTIKLTYVVPSNASPELKNQIRHITASFRETQVKEVWDRIHSEGGSDFTEIEMEEFHRELGGVVEANSGLRLQQLSLAQISLPFFRAHQSGKVKVDCVRHVRPVMRYLTELCQGNMFQADPSLGLEQEDETMQH